MKRLLTVALASLLASPLLACPPHATYSSPNGRFSATEFSADGCSLEASSDKCFEHSKSISYGGLRSEWTLVKNSGEMVAVAANRSLRLYSAAGQLLGSAEIQLRNRLHFIGGWIAADGTCFWESRQGGLWVWRRGCGTISLVDPAQLKSLVADQEASPVSLLRWAISQRLVLPADWLARRESQILKQNDGPSTLKCYRAWLSDRSGGKLLKLLGTPRYFTAFSGTQAKGVPLSPRLSKLCRAVESLKWLPGWLVTEDDLAALQRAVGSDPERLHTLLKMHALRPDLAISPELVPLIKQMRLKDSYEGRNLILYLAEAGVEPEKLVELLYPEFSDLEGLLDFYAHQPCLEAIPALIDLLPNSELAVRRALYRQLRVDLGADQAKWRAWIAEPQHDPAERGKELLLNGDAGGLLWSARAADLSVLSNGAMPRLVQRISAQQVGELWVDASRVGRKNVFTPQRDWCWELSGGKSLWPIPETLEGYFRGISRPSGELVLEYDLGSKSEVVWLQNGIFQHLAKPVAKQEAGVRKLIAEQNFDPPDIHTEARDSLFYQTGHCQGLSLSDYKNKEGQSLFAMGAIGRLSPDGCWRALALMCTPGVEQHFGYDHTSLTIWNTSLRKLELKLQVPCDMQRSAFCGNGRITPHCFSPDSRWLALGAEKLTLVSTEGDSPHKVSAQAAKAKSLAFHPKADRLAVGTENELVLMHLPDLKVEQIIRGLGPINGLAYSPDGSLLAVALQDEIRVYQTNSPWPTQEGQDPQLLSELWTGMRLSGGAAVRLSEAEFKQRLERWKSETGSDWWNGCPKPISQPGRAEFPPLALAGLAVSASFLGYSLWQKRRCAKNALPGLQSR